jgi:hypothetical protein
VKAREEKLRALARSQIRYCIQGDIDGGESLMKEVWEQCEDQAEIDVVTDELRRLAAAIERMGVE